MGMLIGQATGHIRRFIGVFALAFICQIGD